MVSIIVPVYNAEKFLHKCIDSVLNQTYADFELILVNDGSKDDSEKICKEYAKKDGRVKLITKNNEGVSIARNYGISVANGEYITFIDSDDSVDNDFLEIAIETICDTNADLYISGIQMETVENNKIVNIKEYKTVESKTYNTRQLLEDLNVKYPLICISGPWCKIYKSSIIKNNNIFFQHDLDLGEDTYFNLEYIKLSDKIYFSDKIFYHYYRTNNNSLFTRFNPKQYYCTVQVFDKMRELMVELGCSSQTMKRFATMYFSSIFSCIQKCYIHSQPKEIKMLNMTMVSKNYYICALKFKDVVKFKNKVFLFLIKYKFFGVLNLILKLYYRHTI